MHKLMELKEMLCKQLEEYSSKEITAGSLEVIDKLSHSIKNLDKIIEAYEQEYSNDSMDGGSYGGSYGGGSYGGSYRRGRYSSEGSYARGRGRNASRDSMGRYSSERGYSRDGYSMAADDMVEELRGLMQEAPDDKTRQELQQLIRKMEQK